HPAEAGGDEQHQGQQAEQTRSSHGGFNLVERREKGRAAIACVPGSWLGCRSGRRPACRGRTGGPPVPTEEEASEDACPTTCASAGARSPPACPDPRRRTTTRLTAPV